MCQDQAPHRPRCRPHRRPFPPTTAMTQTSPSPIKCSSHLPLSFPPTPKLPRATNRVPSESCAPLPTSTQPCFRHLAVRAPRRRSTPHPGLYLSPPNRRRTTTRIANPSSTTARHTPAFYYRHPCPPQASPPPPSASPPQGQAQPLPISPSPQPNPHPHHKPETASAFVASGRCLPLLPAI